MSRYIDADALIEKFGELTVMLWLDSVEEAEIVSLIGNAPSIDIVRCKECENFIPMTHGCKRSPSVEPWWEDDFCSYGEREGE